MEISKEGDLTQLNKDIEKVFEAHGFGRPAMVVCFQKKNDKTVHWVSNVKRTDMLMLLDNIKTYILSKSN